MSLVISDGTENNSENFKKEELSSQPFEEVCILEIFKVCFSALGPPLYQLRGMRVKKWSPNSHVTTGSFARVEESPPKYYSEGCLMHLVDHLCLRWEETNSECRLYAKQVISVNCDFRMGWELFLIPLLEKIEA